MTGQICQTHNTAEQALDAIKQLDLAATARNFEIWSIHVEGSNPALSHDLRRQIESEEGLDQACVDAIYERHLARTELANNFVALVSRFETEIGDLFETIEKTGANAQGHDKKLSALSTQLGEMTGDHSDVGALLESVIAVTRTMRDENRKLESRLAASTVEISHLRHNVETIQREAMTDALTGINNRKAFDLLLQEHIEKTKTNQTQMMLIFADIDHFKKFNDRWGHQTGDQVLRLVATVMKSTLKGQDILARYGGEEFAIILPDTSMDNARMLADRIRQTIESRRLKKRRTNEDLGVVTVSMGVTAFREEDTPETFIERADERLYAAKGAGRNRVLCDGEQDFESWADEVA